MENIIIRDAVLADAPRLLEIYKYYVENTAITFEIGAPSLAEFERRMKALTAKYPYLAAESGGEIAGYACASPFVGRQAYEHSAETTIYLDPAIRHRGLGKRLYLSLEDILQRMNVFNLYACIGIPEKNDKYLTDNSMKFHEHLGYKTVGTFKKCGYKFGRWYTMIWMEKLIGNHSQSPKPFIKYNDLK